MTISFDYASQQRLRYSFESWVSCLVVYLFEWPPSFKGYSSLQERIDLLLSGEALTISFDYNTSLQRLLYNFESVSFDSNYR